METNLYTRQDAYRFDETEESVILLRSKAKTSDLSTYYVCGYTAMDNTVPLFILKETCDFTEAKKLIKEAVEAEISNTNSTFDAFVEFEDLIDYFVIYVPNADVFIAFDENVENIIGIHPANFLKDNKYEVIVKPEE